MKRGIIFSFSIGLIVGALCVGKLTSLYYGYVQPGYLSVTTSVILSYTAEGDIEKGRIFGEKLLLSALVQLHHQLDDPLLPRSWREQGEYSFEKGLNYFKKYNPNAIREFIDSADRESERQRRKEAFREKRGQEN
ncbi:MAG: hypothetical protein II841_12220 [Bacteroidales bacterium]|jgi:hypothetical protein|nr:hypothetical protein [Bacteroidales bacterium]MBQ9343891.1 hypothetical protein [Kiritimatiellia bacterium]